MKNLTNLILVIFNSVIAFSVHAQNDFLFEDYKIFGRKESLSLGSVFGTLGTSSILVNPANVAFVTDNRINFGRGQSGIGNGTFFSWMAPNMSISSSVQKVAFGDSNRVNHEKQLLHFSFGLSTKDLGSDSKDSAIGIGFAIKRQADHLYTLGREKTAGGNSISIDAGLLFKWKQMALEMVILDINNPELSDSDASYGRGFIVGGRFTTSACLTIALQGTGGNSYAGSDFGLSVGAEQSFLEHRLIARLQLTSFFAGSAARMQNISAGIGYRLDPKNRLATFLKDLEFSYALSYLALPENVGTHMLVITKYF